MKKSVEQVYEEEIKLLQEEILMLQSQQENNEREITLHFKQDMQLAFTSKASKSIMDVRSGSKDTVATLKLELENLEEDLAQQTKINGIVLTDCKVTTLEKSNTKIVQQHRISGHCYYLAFQVEFEITDVKEDTSVIRSVTDLNIVVDGCEFSDISTFVSGVEEKKSLLLFFRTLKAFAERCEHRNRTFLHFKSSLCSRDQGSILGGMWRLNL
ncbi:hypothetical protein MATL_G00077160 [Megalops atlanticus]|uniref:Centromere protein P n=1 Tax=Megalops atlanticus TaxID=7932 RepID=A0A9D3Q5D2_MEGAT|nr:hypothetical protein MATL_G00077160 [Megalops atlanticus]